MCCCIVDMIGLGLVRYCFVATSLAWEESDMVEYFFASGGSFADVRVGNLLEGRTDEVLLEVAVSPTILLLLRIFV